MKKIYLLFIALFSFSLNTYENTNNLQQNALEQIESRQQEDVFNFNYRLGNDWVYQTYEVVFSQDNEQFLRFGSDDNRYSFLYNGHSINLVETPIGNFSWLGDSSPTDHLWLSVGTNVRFDEIWWTEPRLIEFELTWSFLSLVVEEPEIEHIERDIHIPINLGSDFDLLTTLNYEITINFVNQQGLSIIELYENGSLILLPLDTDDFEIPFELGTFRFWLYVTDDFGNTADLYIYIHTFDRDKPQILGNLNTSTTNDVLLSFEEIFSDITIVDNFDNLSIENIEILEDNYTSNYNIGGVWGIVFRVTDFSNNEIVATKLIHVEDVLSPLINGIEETISRDISTDLNSNNVLAMLTAYDETDGDITDRIRILEDNLIGNEMQAGIFLILFEVSDLSGNITQRSVLVENVSDTLPIFIIDSTFLVVERGTIVTEEQLIDFLIKRNIIDVPKNAIIQINSDWLGNFDVNGIFELQVEVFSQEGTLLRQMDLSVNVRETLVDVVELPPNKLSGLQKFLNFLLWLLKALIDLIVWLWQGFWSLFAKLI